MEQAKIKAAKQENGYIDQVTDEDVAAVVSQWTGVPLQQLEKKESQRLLDLEKVLHKRVVGQEEAVKAISRAIRRARSGLKDPNRPIGSFMFLGPTGVGKTELAKALAEAMFGSEEALIRVDMSEYMEKYSTSRLIGSPPGYVGYEEGGQLTEKIRQKPYSVILLDEVEKAHPMMEKRILEELKKAFRPEFLNRIDETVVFKSLDQEQIHEIVKIMSRAVLDRMKEHEIKVKITSAAYDVIGKVGFDPEYGARPIRRALQKEIEDRLAEALLSGQIQLGDTVTIGASKGKITLTVKNPKEEKIPEKV